MSAIPGYRDMKGFYNGAAYADLDNDGDLDVVINCIEAPAVVLKNNMPPNFPLKWCFAETIKTGSVSAPGFGCSPAAKCNTSN